jgi:hypothetical protein
MQQLGTWAAGDGGEIARVEGGSSRGYSIQLDDLLYSFRLYKVHCRESKEWNDLLLSFFCFCL